jgi:hypothetical protein
MRLDARDGTGIFEGPEDTHVAGVVALIERRSPELRTGFGSFEAPDARLAIFDEFERYKFLERKLLGCGWVVRVVRVANSDACGATRRGIREN